MNAAIPSTTNARMMRQTSTIATVIPADIVVMSIILNCFPEMRPLRDLQLPACERRGSRPLSPVDEAYSETYRRSWRPVLEEAMRLS